MVSKRDAAEFARAQARVLAMRLAEPRRFLQVVAGPRQAGKTTLVRQALAAWGERARYASADEPTLRARAWIAAQWDTARLTAREAGRRGAVLALDEIQKIPDGSETVKRLWDEDTAERLPLRVVILGSAPLLIQRGLTESLAGRFELVPVGHWTLAEMREAFGFGLDQYLFFGGYPGAAPLIKDPARWARYVKDALIETTLSRDVLLLTRVDKPALLRRLFDLGCRYSGQVLWTLWSKPGAGWSRSRSSRAGGAIRCPGSRLFRPQRNLSNSSRAVPCSWGPTACRSRRSSPGP